MKLIDIWFSGVPWQNLSALRISPQMAFDLMSYREKVLTVLKTCEAQSQAIAKGIADKSIGGVCSVNGQVRLGSPEDNAAWEAEFNAYMKDDIEFPLCSITLQAVLDELKRRPENVISAADLALLKPFFSEPPK